jgi:MFS family permease
MSTTDAQSPSDGSAGFLDRRRSIAPPGYNRWLVPPAALAIHLAIGQVYAFSVFTKPLTQPIGVTESTAGVWKPEQLGWVFSIAIVFLGLSAAIFGPWLERVGPRKAMFVSALCFGGGFLISAVGVYYHQFLLLCLGYGVLGGIGLGLGYISPVSTLIKWFPDRPGMATGLAIMGFGGGGMIGSPLATRLMDHFRGPSSPGVVETFGVMGLVYLAFMMFGVFTVRLPAPGWKPAGFTPKRNDRPAGQADFTANQAVQTPQFWLLWCVLFLNVSAGIGVLGQASLMSQEMFPERVSASAAAGFVGLLSLFNMVGRFFWSSLSDIIGRKATYAVFFSLGAVLYALTPQSGRIGSVLLFVAGYAVILSMYGGGFATIPAYLRDLFGTSYVGAIHGRLLTAWSLAGVAGPVLVNYIRAYQIDHGVAKVNAYTSTMYLMAGLLVIGFICNMLVRRVEQDPVSLPETGPSSIDADGQRGIQLPGAVMSVANPDTVLESPSRDRSVNVVRLILRWSVAVVPLAWGVWQTTLTSLALFQ